MSEPEDERWFGERLGMPDPTPLDGTTTDCPVVGVHEHVFRGPHRFHEWDPACYIPPVRFGVMAPHPGQNHEFCTTCRLCGERGVLHISLATPNEVVRIEPSDPLHLGGRTGA